VANYTDGFVMLGRWHRLFDGAIESLWSTRAVPERSDREFWRDTAVVVVTSRLADGRFGTEAEPDVDTAFVRSMIERNFGDTLSPDLVAAVPAGRVGVAAALGGAGRWFAERKCSRTLIVAVDSYLDPITLEWLLGDRRLKDGDHPAGLSPGEAGACLLLETDAAAVAREAPVLMRLAGVGRGSDYSIYDEQRNVGRGLAQAVTESLDQAGIREPFTGDIIIDLNGEVWRATEYGGARVLLRPRLGEVLNEVTPAVSIGDVGSASAAVALCIAARSFVRGYATGDKTLVLISTERGESAAFVTQSAR
jgi:3-oxoacyl-[acyl-carrier-protein] synthase-1